MERNDEHESLVRWLARPEAYPHRPDRVEQIQTHISQVFLAGSRVYKLKKPVKFDFLDFSTRAAREQACREEVRLNRRLARDVYLDVVPITEDDHGELRLGKRGRESLVRQGKRSREGTVNKRLPSPFPPLLRRIDR